MSSPVSAATDSNADSDTHSDTQSVTSDSESASTATDPEPAHPKSLSAASEASRDALHLAMSRTDGALNRPLLGFIYAVFRANGYPARLPMKYVLAAINTYGPRALSASPQWPFILSHCLPLTAEYRGPFIAATENPPTWGVRFFYDDVWLTEVNQVALDHPLPPSQLHRLVKAIINSPYCFIAEEGSGLEHCIPSVQVNTLLRKLHELPRCFPVMNCPHGLDDHSLIDAFDTDQGTVYTLTRWDWGAIRQYLDKADSAVGAPIYSPEDIRGLATGEEGD